MSGNKPTDNQQRYKPKKITGVKIALAVLIALVVIGWAVSQLG
ncbi:hypothetical protein ACFSSC_02900 [Corynebacterium mendelii]|nr:hypothetical protein [Corynebacterium mendelii]